MEAVLLDGHRRSPATLPGYTEGVRDAVKASSTRMTRRRWRRSSRLRARSAAARTASGSAHCPLQHGRLHSVKRVLRLLSCASYVTPICSCMAAS